MRILLAPLLLCFNADVILAPADSFTRTAGNKMRTPIAEKRPSPSGSYTTRWDDLLAENSILHREHHELLASFTSPLSPQQKQLSEASAARFASLPPKIRQLVEDWAKSWSP